jgi:hypothetical protein
MTAEVLGRIRYAVDGAGMPVDVDDVIARAGNVADDLFATRLAGQAELFRTLGGMSESAIEAEMARCRAAWIEDRAKLLAEMRTNLCKGERT